MNENTNFDELRNLSRATFESLEIWLRNIIDIQLTKNYGGNYFEFIDENENRIIKKKIFESSLLKYNSEPGRYSRLIDTTFFDDIIDIICNPKLYNDNFKTPLNRVFKLGREQARLNFENIKEIRNYLSHSNHISNRQAEQIICYSKDIIDSLKEFYLETNREKEFNVPSIVSFRDSKGNVMFSSQFTRVANTNLIDNKETNIFEGEILSMEVVVDESFEKDNYTIKWLYIGGKSVFDIKEVKGNKLTIELTSELVRENLKIECLIISNNNWHKFRNYDDKLMVLYKVKPI